LKPAGDPGTDYKTLVREGYDRCAVDYAQARRGETEQALAHVTLRLGSGARALDIGCGGGIPVARELARVATVTGVDISDEMITLARQNVPTGTFIRGDIMAQDFPPAHFDAVVSFYAIFHLPREEHEVLFRRIHRWLKPGGYLLATLSARNEPAYTEDDFHGVTMVWSNFSLDEYRGLLLETGFELLEVADVGHGYDEVDDVPVEVHPIVLARRRRWH